MKKIEAVLRPEKLEELKEALQRANVDGVTINPVLGCGNQHGWTEYYRSSEIIMNVLPKIEVKMVVSDERVQEMVALIVSVARTGDNGEVGDGKIFISDIVDCIRIRTGETGIAAL